MDYVYAWIGTRFSEALRRQLVAHWLVVAIPRDVVLPSMRVCPPFHTPCFNSFYVADCARPKELGVKN